MTVKELIEALQTFPDDTFVYSEMRGFYDSEDGPLNIQGCTSALNYDEKDDLLHIVANFDIATTVSKQQIITVGLAKGLRHRSATPIYVGSNPMSDLRTFSSVG